MKACVGLLPVESGTLTLLGVNPADRGTREDLQARVGYLPQDFGYVPSFRVHEFVEYGAWLKAVPKENRSAKVEEALKVVNLASSSSQRMGRLSGGMRRRAGIAQTMVHGPDLLILDEPSTGLDPEERVRFRELIRSVSPGRTILLSSHLVEDVRALADTVIVIDKGRVGFIGTVNELEARALEGAAGDSDLERGYISVLGSMEML